MNRLISAEWYRVRKCNNLFIWNLILIIFFTFIGMYESGMVEERLTVIDAFSGMVGTISASILYVSLILAASFSVSYDNKVLHYDMMAGNKISHIILSKIIVVAPLLTVFMTICIVLSTFCVSSVNGVGDAKLLFEYLGLFTCINFRFIVVSILIMTIFKGTLGVLVVFIRVGVIDMIPMAYFMFQKEDGKNVSNLAKMIPSMQYNYLDGSTIKGDFAAIVIISMLVEILIMYMLSYISHKKKLFY